jgi:hypothetical protein
MHVVEELRGELVVFMRLTIDVFPATRSFSAFSFAMFLLKDTRILRPRTFVTPWRIVVDLPLPATALTTTFPEPEASSSKIAC